MPQTYFNSLNYTLGNEDTALELGIMPENARHLFAVAGSGSRIIPLLAKNPHVVTCVDASAAQLSLAELRIASLKALNYENFLSFWGYPSAPMSSKERKNIFNNLVISERAEKNIRPLFEKNAWGALLYAGRWEQTFQKLSQINRRIIGKKGTDIFDCRSLKEQKNYLQTKFPQKRWSFSVFLLGNASVFNALLYKGNFPKKNIPNSMHSFYVERFESLFQQGLARENYFLQLLFFGKLQFTEGLPIECDREIFLKAKSGLQQTQITYVLGDVAEEAGRATVPIDFLSLSDVPSYLSVPKEQEFLQDIKRHISPGGIVASRYYLRIPENVNTDGYKNITDNFKKTISEEKIGMYSFGIYQKM